jgi:predicted transcriptional regulator
MKASFAVMALLSLIKIEEVQAINIQTDIGNGLDESQTTDAYSEANRFINSKGEAIILSQTEGHARIVMSKTRKYSEPQPLDVANVQLTNCQEKNTES